MFRTVTFFRYGEFLTERTTRENHDAIVNLYVGHGWTIFSILSAVTK